MPVAEPVPGVQGPGPVCCAALFDFNFNNFVAVKFARIIYLIATILAVCLMLFGWLLPAFTLFSESFILGVPALFLGWIPVGVAALLQLVLIRVFLEFVISSVKTAENTSKLVEQGAAR